MAGDPPGCPAGFASRLGWDPPCRTTATLSAAQRLNRILDHAVGDFNRDVEPGTALRQLRKRSGATGSGLAIDWPWGMRPMASGAGWSGGLVPRPGRWALPSLPRCARSTDRIGAGIETMGSSHGPAAERWSKKCGGLRT